MDAYEEAEAHAIEKIAKALHDEFRRAGTPGHLHTWKKCSHHVYFRKRARALFFKFQYLPTRSDFNPPQGSYV